MCRRPRATFQSSLRGLAPLLPVQTQLLATPSSCAPFCDHRQALQRSPRGRTGLPAWLWRSGLHRSGVAFLFTCVIAGWSSHFPLVRSAAWYITPTRNIRQRRSSCRSKPTVSAWLKACHCRKLPRLLWRRIRSSRERGVPCPASPLQLARCHSAMNCRPPSREAKVVVRAPTATSRLR